MSITDGLSPAERDLLRVLTPDLKLARSAKVGEAFSLAYVHTGSDLDRMRFSEELVYGLIAKGFIYVLQAAYAVPPATERVPYTARLDRQGEVAHAKIKAETPRKMDKAA